MVLWGCCGGVGRLFNWCSVRLEGGDVDIFGVLWRFDVCIERFSGVLGAFGLVWRCLECDVGGILEVLEAFYGMFGCVGGILGVLGAFWGSWTRIVKQPLQSVRI